jgi:hypothetical protein
MTQKTPPRQTEAQAAQTPRRLKLGTYQRGKFQKRIKHPGPKLPSSLRLFRQSLGTIRRNKLLFGVIFVVYLLLSVLLVRGFSNVANLPGVKSALLASHDGTWSVGTNLLGNLFSAATPTGTVTAANAYQSMLFLIISLVIIFALRQVYGKQVRPAPIKASFYKSTQQLIPFVLVLLVIGLQFIPLLIGSSIYSFVVTGGVIVGPLEQILCLTVLALLVISSFYMMTSSLVALYIVTLPDVKPVQALRSAKELVRFRRWTVMRKIIALPIIIFICVIVIMMPIVLFLTPVAEWLFFALSLGLLIVAQGMWQIHGRVFRVCNQAANSFQLEDVSGGTGIDTTSTRATCSCSSGSILDKSIS